MVGHADLRNFINQLRKLGELKVIEGADWCLSHREKVRLLAWSFIGPLWGGSLQRLAISWPTDFRQLLISPDTYAIKDVGELLFLLVDCS